MTSGDWRRNSVTRRGKLRFGFRELLVESLVLSREAWRKGIGSLFVVLVYALPTLFSSCFFTPNATSNQKDSRPLLASSLALFEVALEHFQNWFACPSVYFARALAIHIGR